MTKSSLYLITQFVIPTERSDEESLKTLNKKTITNGPST